jgi:single-stranded-DNA-specific exonuclease
MHTITNSDIYNILNKRLSDDNVCSLGRLPDPFLFKDMDKSCTRIEQAINNDEKITIVGDYDVDGVVSSVLIKEFFLSIDKRIDIIIPNRFSDGYGISPSIVNRITDGLIITVDNGISANKAADVCLKKNIDLIITDHHTVPKIVPKAYAIINQKQKMCNFPEKEICGATISWYLIAGLKHTMKLDIDLKKYLDILAIAIIADIMPLKSINRTLVKTGLKLFNDTKRVPLQVLKQNIKKNSISSEDIAFLISPKINSAGRINSAMLAYEFLLQTDKQKAQKLHQELSTLNEKRKKLQNEVELQAIDKSINLKSIIVVWGDDWNEGVIGIVASKLSNRFKLPSIVLSRKNGLLKGSARSIGEVDIYNLIMKSSKYLIGFGGHKAAAGLSLEFKNFDLFKQTIENNAMLINKTLFIEESQSLGCIKIDDINFDIIDTLEIFEPFGKDNPSPIFQTNNVSLIEVKFMGSENQHLALKLQQNNNIVNGVIFFTSKQLNVGDKIDFHFSIKKNIYQGRVSFKLFLKEDSIIKSLQV